MYNNNNEFNNNNQNNNYMTNPMPNSTNDGMNNSKLGGNKNKTMIIVIGVIAVIVIVFLLKGFSGSSIKSGKNTTGSTEYDSSDVDFSCTSVSKSDNLTITTYSDFIFNYKTTGTSGTQYNYQLKKYNKMVLEFKNYITDDKYKDFIDELNSLECLDTGSCTGSHLELGITKYGWDTVVDRSSKKIEMTYYNLNGMGTTATKDDMKNVKADYESNGFECN